MNASRSEAMNAVHGKRGVGCLQSFEIPVVRCYAPAADVVGRHQLCDECGVIVEDGTHVVFYHLPESGLLWGGFVEDGEDLVEAWSLSKWVDAGEKGLLAYAWSISCLRSYSFFGFSRNSFFSSSVYVKFCPSRANCATKLGMIHVG